MELIKKLNKIQKELKAPKSQFNKFGNYNYRSCEDILEAVKPLLDGAGLIITDEIVMIGTRYYVKATVKLMDDTKDEMIENTAYARESEIKKGMDESQITGAASSYARKYALNGLFLIDDTKDADTDEHQQQQQKAAPQRPAYQPAQKPAYSKAPQSVSLLWAKIRKNVSVDQKMTPEQAHAVKKLIEDKTGFPVETLKFEDQTAKNLLELWKD